MKLSKITDKDTSLPDALNAFYAQFEQNASGAVTPAPTALDIPMPTVTSADARSVFLDVNPGKAMGPDGAPSRELRSCADQLVKVFIAMFNLSLLQAEVPTCFKKTTIIPIPKKAHAMCLNNYCSVTLTSIIMKTFERLVMAHMRQLKKFATSVGTLTNFYGSTIESILSKYIMTWYGNCSAQDRKKLQKVVCIA
eukprot:g28669.t1